MHRLLSILLVTVLLFGCSSSSDLKVSPSNPASGSNSLSSGDYTFTLTLNDNSESSSLLTAELRYDGAEEEVVIQHSSEILYYEVFDENGNVMYAEFPTDEANQTTIRSGESILAELDVSLSDLRSPGEYTVLAVAEFSDTKKYEIENTLKFKVE